MERTISNPENLMKSNPENLSELCSALSEALGQYPEERKTILRGFECALDGAVTLRDTGIHHVKSASFPGEYYLTTLCACSCRAVAKSPGGRCKHRYAVALVVLATREQPKTMAQQIVDPEWLGPAPVTTASLAAQVCNPTYRVKRELAGFSGPTPRHQ